MDTQIAEPSVRERIEAAILDIRNAKTSNAMFDALDGYDAQVIPAAIQQLLAEHDATVQSQGAEIERLTAELQRARETIGLLRSALSHNPRRSK